MASREGKSNAILVHTLDIPPHRRDVLLGKEQIH